MGNGDSRYRSRKFALAVASFLVVTGAMIFGLTLCEEAKDFAIVLGPWGTSDALILGLYSHYNVKAAGV